MTRPGRAPGWGWTEGQGLGRRQGGRRPGAADSDVWRVQAQEPLDVQGEGGPGGDEGFRGGQEGRAGSQAGRVCWTSGEPLST